MKERYYEVNYCGGLMKFTVKERTDGYYNLQCTPCKWSIASQKYIADGNTFELCLSKEEVFEEIASYAEVK